MYIRFHYRIWKFTKTSEAYHINNYVDGTKARAKHVDQLGITVFLGLMAIVICYFPYLVSATYQAVKALKGRTGITRTDILSPMIASISIYFNSTLNSIIFLLGDKKLRRYVSSYFHFGQICNQKSADRSASDRKNVYGEAKNFERVVEDTKV